jgi:hypothetical protein
MPKAMLPMAEPQKAIISQKPISDVSISIGLALKEQ